MTGLQTIDIHNQNKADLNSLTLRLNRLSHNLCNAPRAWGPDEQSRRDSFVRMLQDTSAKVATLHERYLASTSIIQTISGYFIKIDRYLVEYLWTSQMQSQHDVHEELVILRRQQEDHQKLLITMQSLMIRAQSSMGLTAPQLTGTVTLASCVTLVDATGHDHAIPLNFCISFQQVHKMLQVLFECDTIEAHIQRRPLTGHEWSNIPAGTKIVVRIIGVPQNR